MDNDNSAPIVPAGTEKNMFGNNMAFQPKEQGEAVSPQTETETQTVQEGSTGVTFQELAAKKGFKTPDDLARSYANLEQSHTKKSMELSELAEIKLSKPQAQEKVQQLENQGYTQDEAINIVKKLIHDELAPFKEQIAIKETFKNEEDMSYAPQVAELVKRNPTIPWDVALKSVKYDAVVNKLTTEQANRKSQEQNLKERSQVASSGASPRQETNLGSLVNDRTVPFNEVRRIMKDKFSQR